MKRKSFVKNTISPLNEKRLKHLRNILDNKQYIPFDFVDPERIDCSVLEEKISDYFEKVELLAGGKMFNYLIEQYMNALDSVVEDYIDGSSRAKKNGAQTESRAKKYYNKAHAMKKEALESFEALLDYSRIMLCLYMSIINNRFKSISDFDYASESLDGEKIMEALRNEKGSTLLGERKTFDTHGKFSRDRCTFIIIIIMYQYIKNNEVGDED